MLRMGGFDGVRPRGMLPQGSPLLAQQIGSDVCLTSRARARVSAFFGPVAACRRSARMSNGTMRPASIFYWRALCC